MDPAERLEQQALDCRRRWKQLDVDARMRLAASLESGDPLSRAWAEILRGNHSFFVWLEGDAAWPPPLSDASFSPRQLVSSNPIPVVNPWSIRSTYPEFCSTPQG